MESNAAHRNLSSLESWSLITHCGLCLDRATRGSPTLSMSCGLLSAAEMKATSLLGCCTSEDLRPRTFLLEDGGAISVVFPALLLPALRLSLSVVLSKYWPGWTLLISGNQWDDSPGYCSKKTSKEICIYLWLFSTSINMFPRSNGIVTIGSNYCGCIHLLWFNQTDIIC